MPAFVKRPRAPVRSRPRFVRSLGAVFTTAVVLAALVVSQATQSGPRMAAAAPPDLPVDRPLRVLATGDSIDFGTPQSDRSVRRHLLAATRGETLTLDPIGTRRDGRGCDADFSSQLEARAAWSDPSRRGVWRTSLPGELSRRSATGEELPARCCSPSAPRR